MQPLNSTFLQNLRRFFIRKISLLLTAFMLGMSNVLLEEDRSVNDTRAKIEYQELENEDD